MLRQAQQPLSQWMSWMGKSGFVGGGGVVAVGDVEDVVGDIFFDDEPGTAGEAHAFALTDGVEPEAFVLTDTTTGFEFDDITGVFTEVTSDIVVVIDLPQKTDALGVLALGIDEVLTLCNLTYFILDVMTDRKNRLAQLPVVNLREEVGLILHGVRTGDEPLPTCLINLRLGIMARGNQVVVMPSFLIEGPELDETVAHHIGIGRKTRPYLLHRVTGDLIPVFAMTVDDLEVATILYARQPSPSPDPLLKNSPTPCRPQVRS